MVVCNTKPKNYSSLKVWKFNGCLLQTQVHCTTFSFQVFFFFFQHLCIQLVYWLRYMWWLKLNKKFLGALLQCIHVNFFIFFESVNLTHSVESTESKVLEITNLMLKTYIIVIMQFWSLLIIISLNFAYFYATKMSNNLAQPNLTLIAEKFLFDMLWRLQTRAIDVDPAARVCSLGLLFLFLSCWACPREKLSAQRIFTS